MTLFNVLVPVVALVHADTPEAAIQDVKNSLASKGYEPYDAPELCHAFESEDVPSEWAGLPS